MTALSHTFKHCWSETGCRHETFGRSRTVPTSATMETMLSASVASKPMERAVCYDPLLLNGRHVVRDTELCDVLEKRASMDGVETLYPCRRRRPISLSRVTPSKSSVLTHPPLSEGRRSSTIFVPVRPPVCGNPCKVLLRSIRRGRFSDIDVGKRNYSSCRLSEEVRRREGERTDAPWGDNDRYIRRRD